MKKAYNIGLKSKVKKQLKQPYLSTSTQTPHSTILNHIHHSYTNNRIKDSLDQQTTPIDHSNPHSVYRIDKLQYLGLSRFYTNQFKVQAYRQRLSLDFRQLHNQPKTQHTYGISRLKYGRQVDKSLVTKKARVMTEHIYEQQMRDYKQESKLMDRIKQRLALLKEINEQRSELMRSYFRSKK